MGWRVPTGNEFTDFSSSIKADCVGSFDNGYKFIRYAGDTEGIFFPASGKRYYNSSGDSGTEIHMWYSSVHSRTTAYCLISYLNYCHTQRDECFPCGKSIRPVEDDIEKIDKLEGSFTIGSTIYKFAIGMTWADFVDSYQYNSDGEFTFGVGYSINCNGDQIIDDFLNPVLQTHAIINGYSYNL